MLTGTQVFRGDTMLDTLAAVLTREPDWQALPSGTPNAFRHLVWRAVERDVRKRLQSIGEARIVLEDPAALKSDSAVAGASEDPPPRRLRHRALRSSTNVRPRRQVCGRCRCLWIVWRRPERRFSFYTDGSAILAVSIATNGGSPTVSKPAVLFQMRGDANLAPVFEVTPDGKTFYMLRTRGRDQVSVIPTGRVTSRRSRPPRRPPPASARSMASLGHIAVGNCRLSRVQHSRPSLEIARSETVPPDNPRGRVLEEDVSRGLAPRAIDGVMVFRERTDPLHRPVVDRSHGLMRLGQMFEYSRRDCVEVLRTQAGCAPASDERPRRPT